MTHASTARRSIRLEDLPPAPPGRVGWPWTEEVVPPARDVQREVSSPRVTVVTPSYNQAEFLEETVRSVLLQGYPGLEYIVVDGGSTDGSVEIIQKYSPWLAYWCSEEDRGQSHAINKGFGRATGEILGWLNSDDLFYPGALHTVAEELSTADIFLGGMVKVRQEGNNLVEVKRSTPFTGRPIHEYRILRNGPRHEFHFYQPSMFWTARLWEQTGELDEGYHYVMDRQWCNRALAQGAVVALTDRPLARFRLHGDSKSVALHERFAAEVIRMHMRFAFRRDFRFFPCLLSTLGPARGLCGRRARREREQGNLASALVYLNAARAIKVFRSLMRGAPQGQSPEES